ncbi:MAG: LacI family transcriptional regulator [Candidatus Izimaplasma sp.]|nr:LacI family transcriptional regulator [Candidatus Izimaplasma bacterium]
MKKTIYDIAKELGVAPSTVSKALNNSGGISERMRKRVVDYANKVRYFPNSNAAKLKTKKSFTIGIIYSENLGIGLEHNLFSSILQSFKAYVEENGYEISFVVTNLGNRKISYLEYCMQKNIDGVFIVTSVATNPDLQELIESNIACVTTDIYHENLYTIMSDNTMGAKLAVQYLYDLGHRQIAHIRGSKHSTAANERYDGYRQMMEELNLNMDEKLIITSDYYSVDYGYKAGKKFLSYDTIPSAVFCVSDQVAVGFIKALKENDVCVPEDVSVIGFDDLEFVKYLHPSLTTIRQDTHLLGIEAAKKLLSLINQKKRNITGDKKVPVELIVRNSTTVKQDS